jgi:hypothetical protein
LRTFYRLGKINISVKDGGSIVLETINIRRFKILPHSRASIFKPWFTTMVIDGDEFCNGNLSNDVWFENINGEKWKVKPGRLY